MVRSSCIGYACINDQSPCPWLLFDIFFNEKASKNNYILLDLMDIGDFFGFKTFA